MLLKFTKKPEFYVNLDKDFLSEIYEIESDSNEGMFKVGNEYLDFKKIILEIQRVDYNTLKNIYLTIPDVSKDNLNIFAKFFEFTEDQKKEIENVDKARAIFSIDKDVLNNIIQPEYNSPEKSMDIFNFVDEFDEPILLDFKYYNIEGLS